MKSPVENNPVQLSLKWLTLEYCILPDPVNTDINVCNNRIPLSGKAECDDIGKVVVAKKFLIYAMYLLISRKNKVD